MTRQLIKKAEAKGIRVEFISPSEALIHVGEWSRKVVCNQRPFDKNRMREFHRDIEAVIDQADTFGRAGSFSTFLQARGIEFVNLGFYAQERGYPNADAFLIDLLYQFETGSDPLIASGLEWFPKLQRWLDQKTRGQADG